MLFGASQRGELSSQAHVTEVRPVRYAALQKSGFYCEGRAIGYAMEMRLVLVAVLGECAGRKGKGSLQHSGLTRAKTHERHPKTTASASQ